MNGAIGESLPLAIGIAISPMPIIATILMLMSPRAGKTSLGFLFGWLAGTAIAVVAFTLLANVLPEQNGEGGRPAVAIVQLLLGAGLLALAVRSWRSRPGPNDEPELPSWMSAIDSMGTRKALTLAFLLSAANPKNLLLAMSAGVLIGHAGLSTGGTAGTIAIFVAIAGSSVAVPVIAFQLAPQRIGTMLQHVRTWLVANNVTIMAILLLVIGAKVLGSGIASF